MLYEDPLLRPTKVTAPNGAETISEYGAGTDASTRWVKVTSDIDETNSKYAISWFDGLGRPWLSQSEDSAGDVFGVTCYDNMGRVAKSSNPFRNVSNPDCSSALEWTTPAYDDLGRTISVTTPDSAAVGTSYGLATSGSQIGTTVTVTDQAGKLRRSITNAQGQLTRVDEPDNSSPTGSLGAVNAPYQPTIYGYDILNNLISVLQEGNTTAECGGASTCTQTRSFIYDALSRLKSATNPESGTIDYDYDPTGNLSSKTDARGVKTDYVYDALSRVTNRNYSLTGSTPPNYQASPNVTYYYDNVTNAKGKLIRVSSSVSTTEYTAFDILGRVTAHKQTTDGNDYTTGYTYNLSGALIEETYPSGRRVANTLDADGDLAQVHSKKTSTDIWRPHAGSFVYNAAGAVSSLKLGNGKFENTVFNARLQPIQIGLGSSASTQNLLKLDYDYGTSENNGNVLNQTIAVPAIGQNPAFVATQVYAYDSLNRLSQATETIPNQTGWNQTFSYDRFGNRNLVEAPTTTLPKLCNGNTTVCPEDVPKVNPSVNTANNRLNGYSFDSAGNTTTDADNRTFTYDAENKQVKVSDASGIVGQYFYDGDGLRIKKIVPSTGETTIFVYDASNKLVAEYSTIVEPQATAKASYLTSDHLGSPRINTDQLGAIISRHDYHPFGEEVVRTGYGADAIRKQFTGYERDNESGLDFAQARMYAKNHGRFTSVDPLNVIFEMDQGKDETEQIQILLRYISDPQNWNRFVYVTNNPYKYIDPDGFERYDSSVTADEEKKLRAGLRYVAEHGNKQQRKIAQAIIDSNLLVRVTAAKNIGGASGTTGIIDAKATNSAIQSSRLNETQALDHVVITVARETVASGQRGITGTFVHEGRHAWHDAMAISSFSYADSRPNIFNPTYFQTEYGARETYATWAINSGKSDYVAEAVSMGVVVSKKGGGYAVSDQGIRKILASSAYGLTEKVHGGTFSYRTGVGMRPTPKK